MKYLKITAVFLASLFILGTFPLSRSDQAPENLATQENSPPENFDNNLVYENSPPDSPAQPYDSSPPCGELDPPSWPPLQPFTGEGWSHRRTITVTNPGGALENYQIRIENFDTSTLIDENRLRPDAGDLRFSWQGLELPYWIENGINTPNTLVWVRVPSLPENSTTTIYMHYGDPSASSAENGDAVFDFFDNFSGENMDDSKWATHDGWPMGGWPGVKNGIMTCDSSVQLKGVYSRGTFAPPTVLRFRAKMAPANYSMGGFWGVYGLPYYVAAYYYLGDHIAYVTPHCESFSLPADNWYTYELRRENDNQRWYLDDVLDVTQPYPIPTPAYIIFYSHSGGRIDVDWVMIRRYAEPEPVAVVGVADNTPPVSSVDTIEPYWQPSMSFDVYASASDPSGVKSVELWYRHSIDNASWSGWERWIIVDEAPPWRFSFDAIYRDGYYEFYGIATDNVGNRENENAKREAANAGRPEAKCAVVDVERWFPHYYFSKDEPNLPCSFYFDWDSDVSNNPVDYDARVGSYGRYYAYIHTVADTNRFTIQYWLYYANQKKIGALGHPHDWEPVLVVFEQTDLSRPSEVGWGRHGRIIYHGYNFAKKVGTHPISYVARDGHGNYPRMPDENGYIWTELPIIPVIKDEWEEGGVTLDHLDFELYLVGNRASGVELLDTKKQTYGREDEYTLVTDIYKYRYFDPVGLLTGRLLPGIEQPEPADGAWPEDYPDFGDFAPWLVPDFRGQWVWKRWLFIPYLDRKYDYYGRVWDETRPDPDREWWTCLVRSPVDLHVYDSFGRHVGINYETGEIETQIPGSMFDISPENHQRVTIYYPLMDNYRVEIVGRENGTYSFYALYWDNLEPVYWEAKENIEIMRGEIHESYSIPGILATVNIDPDTLNLRSSGKWVTCYIELPERFDVRNIDISTVQLVTDKGVIRAESNHNYGFVRSPEIRDRDGNGLLELMVKFDRRALTDIVDVGDQLVRIAGRVGESLFQGQDTIKVRN